MWDGICNEHSCVIGQLESGIAPSCPQEWSGNGVVMEGTLGLSVG